MNKPSSYQKDLIESLKDPCEAAAYLNAAIEEGDRSVFLLALRNVAEANGGMAFLAKKSSLSGESLYRMLSKRGNPEIRAFIHFFGPRGCVSQSNRKSTNVRLSDSGIRLLVIPRLVALRGR